MPKIHLETYINASADTCFNLMRDIRLHPDTADQTNQRSETGAAGSIIGLGQKVTFESKHFGMQQRLTVQVVEFERPRLFVDEMIEGRFVSFTHVHEFVPDGPGTLMKDTLVWRSPYGIFGTIVDKLVLERHMRDLVSARNVRLKNIAENAV